MADSCLFCYITDRTQFPGDETARRQALLAKIAAAARAGVDYVQLREKDLPTRELESLAREAVCTIREAKLATGHRPLTTALLLNSRTDVALAVGADSVHLPSGDISPAEVRRIWDQCGAGAPSTSLRAGPTRERPVVTVACHTQEDVVRARSEGADLAIFAPVFEKKDRPGTEPAGLEALREACQIEIPVLALGGVTLENAAACLEAGAAGIAAIRLFQENKIEDVVRSLRRT